MAMPLNILCSDELFYMTGTRLCVWAVVTNYRLMRDHLAKSTSVYKYDLHIGKVKYNFVYKTRKLVINVSAIFAEIH